MTINHDDEIEVTGNETLEELEAMLEAMEAEDGDDAVSDDEEVDEPDIDDVQGTAEEGSEGDTNADSPPAEPETQPEGILAKDQKHIIPMEVLERERQENAKLRQELDELKAQSAQFEKAERTIELRNKQLEELGVAPADLPEDVTIDADKLAALQEDYPELAPFFLAMNNRIEALVANGTVAASITQEAPKDNETEYPASPAVNAELTSALQSNSDLNTWMSEGGARWSAAQQIDDHLASSPEWVNRSYAERFEEVSKRVRLAFGDEPRLSADDARKAAQDAANKAKGSLPASPSELGNTNRSANSDLMNRVENASETELSALFDSLTPAQIEQVLANSGY
ncbi:TPA: ATPase [Vibrio vulnificus]|nr:ATPase [Vibrio vulnificus]HDY7898734.1 ATPase [Vibrio vulnificus]HDY7939004.1 ATPase [Vibrio vulnificus]